MVNKDWSREGLQTCVREGKLIPVLAADIGHEDD